MLFNSLEFLFFFSIVFIIYWILKKKSAQNLFLLGISYFFYGFWDYRFLSLIIISSLVDYFVGIKISETSSQNSKKTWLGLSLGVNLGFLLTFKYFNFFITSFSSLVTYFGIATNTHSLNLILPVGISFYTFQTMSYSIDIFRGKLSPSKNIINFCAYVAFFPQLVAGPIERAVNLLPQFNKPRIFNYSKAVDGCRQILWGFFKKVVIADNCAIVVEQIFNGYDQLGGGILILGAVCFAFQIYGDFSGYSDIAIGTAKLLGFDLMQNFSTPYFSRDIAEFWRRWHISLSTWFRDYLYIPLGGSRGGIWMKVRNTFIIFIVSGFWHGANWTFIIWGGIHALLFIPQIIFGNNRKYLDIVAINKSLPSLKEFFQIIFTFFMISIAWIFFRSETLTHSINYIINIFDFSASFTTSINQLKINNDFIFTIFIYILFMLIVEWLNRGYSHSLFRVPTNLFFRYILYLVLFLLTFEYFFGQKSFIYFQF